MAEITKIAQKVAERIFKEAVVLNAGFPAFGQVCGYKRDLVAPIIESAIEETLADEREKVIEKIKSSRYNKAGVDEQWIIGHNDGLDCAVEILGGEL